MKHFNKVAVACAIALMLVSGQAGAQAVGQANHGHHGGGNSGALGSSGSKGNNGSGQSGNGTMGDCDITHYVLCDGR